MKDFLNFLSFFGEMLKRIDERQKKYADSWKTADILMLKTRIEDELFEFDYLWSPNVVSKLQLNEEPYITPELLQELVDIANQCMLLWVRLKEMSNGEEE